MTTARAHRLTSAAVFAVGLALYVAAVSTCAGYPPAAHAQVDPIVLADHAQPVITPPQLTLPVILAPPSWFARAISAARPLASPALGGLAMWLAARLVARARDRWSRWRRGWFGTGAATLYACLTVIGGALAIGVGWDAAVIALTTAIVGGRLLAADPATAKAPPLFPPRRATDGAGES